MTKRTVASECVIGIGELLWDCFPTYRRMGGAPANFAYHASQFGFNTLVVSAVGKDADGDGLLDKLRFHQLDSYIERTDLPTGTVEVDTSNPNDPHYFINTNVAWSAILYTQELEEIAKNCRAVCFGTLAQYGSVSRNTIKQLLDAVPQGCYKVYDINLRANSGMPLYDDETVVNSISKCNVLKVNLEELHYLATLFSLDEKASVEARSKALIEKNPSVKILVVTMGTKGSWVFADGEASFEATPKVNLIDAVGAGDSFTGAFIGSILKGNTIKEAHQLAVKVSAYVCTQPEGMPAMPKEWYC